MELQVPRGNDHRPAVITSEGYSSFQFEEMKKRVTADDFDFVCMTYDGKSRSGKTRPSGPVTFTYITKDGVLHAVRIGTQKILQEV